MARTAPALAFAGVPRVNLMPPVEIERRRRASLARGWVWGVLAAVVAAVLIIMGAFALKLLADQQLAAQQAQTNLLTSELAGLSDVSGALATEQELQSFRSDAMGGDFAWSPIVASIRSALPPDVTLVGFDVVSGGVPQTADPATEIGLTGTLTLESPTPIDLPATVRGIRGLAGVSSVDGRSLSTGQQTVGSYVYELDIAFDQSIYSGQFATQEGGE
ncbi:hypothetical protein G5T42_16845 [Microbacterium sp. 4R-513]|uniref:hypothetical protein n=1 Tax=Microbacterium sp. 4R-513 TaxID=2567934 RepID=UPI0013E11300|nr:hypothetical protein [Microbacterium sp. 4R-513]QIG40933.1 hypothetical protein G5T42_16845 [Microbacterium sp. 4R-513]